MSHTMPAPPLPPAFKLQPNSYAPKLSKSPVNQIEECLWSVDNPELQKACFLARTCSVDPPKSCQYRNINAILQNGPTCGLTAISMLMNGLPTAEQLLSKARNLNYSKNGEIFSAKNLLHLLTQQCGPSADTENSSSSAKECSETNMHKMSTKKCLECEMHEGRLNCAKLKRELLQGSCLLVPYDPDFNHAPCLKYGHKAHWALIVGYLITQEDEFFVISRHGKAKNLAAWSLTALSDSNANLIEFAQPKGYPDLDFIVPSGGIGGDSGLRERAIIVRGEGLPQDRTVIC